MWTKSLARLFFPPQQNINRDSLWPKLSLSIPAPKVPRLPTSAVSGGSSRIFATCARSVFCHHHHPRYPNHPPHPIFFFQLTFGAIDSLPSFLPTSHSPTLCPATWRSTFPDRRSSKTPSSRWALPLWRCTTASPDGLAQCINSGLLHVCSRRRSDNGAEAVRPEEKTLRNLQRGGGPRLRRLSSVTRCFAWFSRLTK